MEKLLLENLYEQVKTMKLSELEQAMIRAKNADEKEFYLKLYNYKLAVNQRKILNMKEFVV